MRRNIKVFFNASVILAGFYSPSGASALLLKKVKEKKIIGFISEIVFDEVLRNTKKINLDKEKVAKFLRKFFIITEAPSQKFFIYFKKIAVDEGDIHLLVSAKNIKTNFLVSLDKKHILCLKNKIKDFKINSPGELINKF